MLQKNHTTILVSFSLSSEHMMLLPHSFCHCASTRCTLNLLRCTRGHHELARTQALYSHPQPPQACTCTSIAAAGGNSADKRGSSTKGNWIRYLCGCQNSCLLGICVVSHASFHSHVSSSSTFPHDTP